MYINSLLVPSTATNVDICEADNKTMKLCISWEKPDGGNEIDNYTITWKKQNDSLPKSFIKEHNCSISAYSHTIENLNPGQKVNVTVTASNVASEGKPKHITYAASKLHLEVI